MSESQKRVALGIVRRDDDVLLIERRNKEQGRENESLSWVFPGGKVEVGETPFAAAEREVFEETGLYVSAISQLDEKQHPSFPAYVYYIACKLAEQDSIDSTDKAVIQAKWVSIARLGLYVTSSLNEKVREYLSTPREA